MIKIIQWRVFFFFLMINKTDQPLARLDNKKKEMTQANKIINKRDIPTDTSEMQKIIRDYFEEWYTNKLDNLE